MEDLTEREYQLLVLLANNYDIAKAARFLGISRQTAKNHLSNAYATLGVKGCIGAFIMVGWLVAPVP
jgi:DNA-binding CsgD family transcriptional regulator